MKAWTLLMLRSLLTAALAVPSATRGQETGTNCPSPTPGVVPGCTTTVRLQDLDPTLSVFSAPASTVISTTAGNGIEGNTTRNWSLNNYGSIIGFADGVSLSSLDDGAAIFENFGSIVGNGNAAANLPKGGTVTNHEGASIVSPLDAVSLTLAGTVINDGRIEGASTGTTHTSVYFGAGGAFTQSVTGEIAGVHGVQFNVGPFEGNNAGSISVTGNAILARTGSQATFINTGTITTTGGHATQMAAVRAQGGAALTLTGDGAIRATGRGAYGVYATDAGTTINATDTRVTTETGASTGVYAENGAAITLNGGSVTTSTDSAHGLVAFSYTSSLVANDVAISTHGASALGARASGAGLGYGTDSVTLNRGSVSTRGDFAYALVATTFDTLTANNVEVITSGDRAGGATSQNSGILELSGGSITTSGVAAAGLSSFGLQGEAAFNDGGAQPVESIVESSDAASGVFTSVSANAGSTLTATSVRVTTSGAAAPGASVRGPSRIAITDSTVNALGIGSPALSATAFRTVGAGTAMIGSSTLDSAQAAGIEVHGTTLDATVDNSTLSGATALSQTSNNGILNLSASGSTLNGVAATASGSETHYSLHGASVWNVAGDSTLTSLEIDDATVRYGGAFDLEGAITLGDVARFDTNGFDATLTQPLVGGGNLTKLGGGTLILTADSSHAGGTTISQGALQLGNGGTAGSVSGNIANDATLIFNRADDVAVDGIVSGAGSVKQIGSGALIFTADQAYTGDTTISSGTLQLGNGGNAGGVAGRVVDNGILVFNRADDFQHAGTISGSGEVVKLAANTLTLSGTHSYSGVTRVNAGKLQVTGSVISNIAVASGATLGGTGTVGAISSAGTVSPGASIGTLHVNGDYSQQPAATLRIEFDDQGHIDMLSITGAASLGGQVAYIPDPASTFAEDAVYTYVAADGGVSGTFGRTQQAYAGVLFETLYSPASVRLRIDSVPIIDNVVTPGGNDLIACVASIDAQRSAVAGTRAAPAMNALVMTPVAALPATVHGICPRDPSALPNSIGTQINARFGLVANRLAQAPSTGDAPPAGIVDSYELRNGVNFWLRGAYLDGAEDARDILRTGYDSHSESLAMGIDFAVRETAVLGSYLARDDLDLDYRSPAIVGGDSAQAEDRAWSAGLYGSYWSRRHWFLQGVLEYGWHEVETTRTLAVGPLGMRATGQRNARAFAVRAGAGYTFELASHWLLQPAVAVNFQRFSDDAYRESGADSLDLTYASLDADTIRGEVGMAARKVIVASRHTGDITAFYGFANYVYDQPLDDRNRAARFAIADWFEIAGDENLREGIHFGVGFEQTWRGDTSLQFVLEAENYGEIETLGASLQFRRNF